jgi:hypothetical protein
MTLTFKCSVIPGERRASGSPARSKELMRHLERSLGLQPRAFERLKQDGDFAAGDVLRARDHPQQCGPEERTPARLSRKMATGTTGQVAILKHGRPSNSAVAEFDGQPPQGEGRMSSHALSQAMTPFVGSGTQLVQSSARQRAGATPALLNAIQHAGSVGRLRFRRSTC